jgi:hypothetical protein
MRWIKLVVKPVVLLVLVMYSVQSKCQMNKHVFYNLTMLWLIRSFDLKVWSNTSLFTTMVVVGFYQAVWWTICWSAERCTLGGSRRRCDWIDVHCTCTLTSYIRMPLKIELEMVVYLSSTVKQGDSLFHHFLQKSFILRFDLDYLSLVWVYSY